MENNKNKILLIILVLLIILGINPSFCAQSSNIVLQLNKIETSIWGFPYSKDDTTKRLTRIENNVFGKTNSTLSDNERINKINNAMGFESFEDSKKQSYEIATQEIQEINYPQLDVLENQLFSTIYSKENIYKRLERLETKLFGSVQEGALSLRTDRLKSFIKMDTAPKSDIDNYYEQPYSITNNIEQYMDSQNKYQNSDIFIQLAGLETILFSKTYSQDPVGLRLNRLERRIFQRDFSSDEEYLRLQRLQAAANAQKTSKLYEANKIQKFASTGMQLGSIILMILAFIL